MVDPLILIHDDVQGRDAVNRCPQRLSDQMRVCQFRTERTRFKRIAHKPQQKCIGVFVGISPPGQFFVGQFQRFGMRGHEHQAIVIWIGHGKFDVGSTAGCESFVRDL